MQLPAKYEGGLTLVLGAWATYDNWTNFRSVRQFDPVSQTEQVNLKATKLQRALWVAASLGLMTYGTFLLAR